MTTTHRDTNYRVDRDGLFVPGFDISHREEEFDSRGFEALAKMQSGHFWYRGRHRFIHHSFFHHVGKLPFREQLSAVDIGGGCGGWINYLHDRSGGMFHELALADSALEALRRAKPLLPESVSRYQIDLLRLGWRDRWDVAFMLDVLEHLSPDREALVQAGEALKPGGLLFVTTPALKFFWSYNDDVAHHVRRYSRADFARLAEQSGLRLLDARYFMFLLSPLLWLARRKGPPVNQMTAAELRALIERTHRIPAAPLNALLTVVFASETPPGHWLRFPWGTSILAVLQKPKSA